MFDETNKTEEQGVELPEKLFGNDDALDSGEAVTEQADDCKDDRPGYDMIKIKYNGEERDITLDEARILAQKGMNYDHVVSERDTKYLRELQLLDKMAAERGMTRSQYMQAMENDIAPGVEKSGAERAREQIKRVSEAVGLSGAWSSLFRQYPELSRSEAYKELGESVRGGKTPLEAYQAKLLSERDRELSIARNNAAATKKTIGSLDGERSERERDEFLEGFFTDD